MISYICQKDARLLYEVGHWNKAIIKRVIIPEGWQIHLISKHTHIPTHVLASKKGLPRLFKTSDSAIQRCKELGFTLITILLSGTDS